MHEETWHSASVATDKKRTAPHGAMRRWRIAGRDSLRLGVLAALIALGDVLVWQVMPGLSLALFCFAVVLAGLGLTGPTLSKRARLALACGGVLTVLPLVELVQPLSLFVAFIGMAALTAVLAQVHVSELLRATPRLLWIAPAQSVRDARLGLAQASTAKSPAAWDLRALVAGWALPALATLVFVSLFAMANPIVDQVLYDLARWQPEAPDLWRLVFWTVLAVAIWPVLVARRMRDRLRYRKPERATVKRPGLINAGSVARSLVAFNALFALQTGLDVIYLYGDTALPEGISPAAYAHRGAYPLLATALLAGLFAVAARPHLQGRPLVRALMMLWLAQTVALVFASVWRLDLYVEAFGLTPLRLAAYIWMAVVAIGLGITAQQVWQDHPAAWMIRRSALLGALTLYACCFVNFDGAVAQHNLTRDVPEDRVLLCRLSEGAMPAIEAHSGMSTAHYCRHHYMPPQLSQPTGWREWGFRNWRVRRSLAVIRHPETVVQ